MTRLLPLSFAILAMAGMGLAQTGSTWTEQWFRAKYGHNSPALEARMQSDVTGAAYRAVAIPEAVSYASNWFKEWHLAKHGRTSPAEETNTAYREDMSLAAQSAVAPGADAWVKGFHKAKYGRELPR